MTWDTTPQIESLQRFYTSDLVSQIVRKSFWDGPHVRFPELIATKFRSFEVGVVIGTAFHQKLRVVLRTLGPTEGFHRLEARLMEEAESRLLNFQRVSYDHHVPNLLDLYMVVELSALSDGKTALVNLRKKKVDLAFALATSDAALIGGIAFGARYPALAKEMWRNVWEQPRATFERMIAEWTLPLLPPPIAITFEQRADAIIDSVRAVVAARFGDIAGYIGSPVKTLTFEQVLVMDDGSSGKLVATLHGIEGWAWDSTDRLLCPDCIQGEMDTDFQFLLKEWKSLVYREFLNKNPKDAKLLKGLIGPKWVEVYNRILAQALNDEELVSETEPFMFDYLAYMAPLARNPRPVDMLKAKPFPTTEWPWRCDQCSRLIVTTFKRLSK